VGGLSVADEDVVAWDGAQFSLLFDGSDVGISGLAIDAFTRTGVNTILLSFSEPGAVPGITGTVDDSDVVRFIAGSLGDTTSGSFSLYFDGSDVGLTTDAEDVDNVELVSGRLLLSTTGASSVPGVSGADEDVLEFTPATLGANTAGTWAMYFDGSDVGLTGSGEDVDGAALKDGKIYLTTGGAFSVSGVSGANEDVFVFTPSSLGSTTAGTFASTLFFDGSAFGLSANDVNAIDVP
jgi:hypothetical protein